MKHRLWRAMVTFPAMALVAGTGTVLAGTAPAAASHVGCGATIATNTTLDSDVGPCSGDGLVVTASSIVLDLGGHRVFAANGPGNNAGVRLSGVSGVTARNGTVDGFDAGVSITGGSGNTVQGVTARNNINPGLQSATTPPVTLPCDLGDGITVLDSANNRINGNVLVNNGPFSGISVVGNSDGNVISGNSVSGSNVHGVRCGNSSQDEGIRIEGPGANHNTVQGNTVKTSLLAGISLHGNVGCNHANPGPDDDPPNTDNVIKGNSVSLTSGTAAADGIAALAQGPFGSVVCAAFRNTITGNTSFQNQGNGIYIPGTSTDNTINSNVVYGNGGDGIRLEGAIFQNTFTNVGPTVFQEVSPTAATYTMGTDYGVLSGSGSGNVTARLVPVGPIVIPPPGFDTAKSGCLASDFAGFPVGAVALIQRGFCDRTLKVANAKAAGASAVVMFNEGSSGRTGLLAAGVDPTTIPVIGTTYALGVALYNQTQAGPVTVHIETHTTNVTMQIAPGAENNTLLGNRGFSNARHDGYDANPTCDNNRWSGNAFGTVNQACVAAGGTGTVTP